MNFRSKSFPRNSLSGVFLDVPYLTDVKFFDVCEVYNDSVLVVLGVFYILSTKDFFLSEEIFNEQYESEERKVYLPLPVRHVFERKGTYDCHS